MSGKGHYSLRLKVRRGKEDEYMEKAGGEEKSMDQHLKSGNILNK